MKLKKTIAAVIAAVITASILSILAIASPALTNFDNPVTVPNAGDVYTQTSTNDDGSVNMRFVCIISEEQAKSNSGVGFLFNANGIARYVTTTYAYRKLNVGSNEVELTTGLYASVFTVYNIPAGSNDVELLGAALVKSPEDLCAVPVSVEEAGEAGKLPDVYYPIVEPSSDPSLEPSQNPSMMPSMDPSSDPSQDPSQNPSMMPSMDPSSDPSLEPSQNPSMMPSMDPSSDPSLDPSQNPSMMPSMDPSSDPSQDPSMMPSMDPSQDVSQEPSLMPSMPASSQEPEATET